MHQNHFRPGFRPGPPWGAYDAPPDPLVGWGGGYPLPIPLPARRLRRLELCSVLRRLSTENPGYASTPLRKISRESVDNLLRYFAYTHGQTDRQTDGQTHTLKQRHIEKALSTLAADRDNNDNGRLCE